MLIQDYLFKNLLFYHLNVKFSCVYEMAVRFNSFYFVRIVRYVTLLEYFVLCTMKYFSFLPLKVLFDDLRLPRIVKL